MEKGFQQTADTGYLLIARVSKLKNPSQWWHLMNYCLIKEEQHKENEAYRYTPCGELVFWMAEVSCAVDKQELSELSKKIITSGEISNRRKWNGEIKNLCWENLKKAVNNYK